MSEKMKDRWDKLQIAGGIFAGIAIPIAVLLVGYWMKNSENDVKFLEIAASILKLEPTTENQALRTWAIEVLVAKTPVPISPKVRTELEKLKVTLFNSYGAVNADPHGGSVGAVSGTGSTK